MLLRFSTCREMARMDRHSIFFRNLEESAYCMKRYSLLRDNQESGPYTIHELKTLGITTTDLIWIESEGTAWIHPTDISELEIMAAEGIKVPLRKAPVKTYPESNESIVYAAVANHSFVDEKTGVI